MQINCDVEEFVQTNQGCIKQFKFGFHIQLCFANRNLGTAALINTAAAVIYNVGMLINTNTLNLFYM